MPYEVGTSQPTLTSAETVLGLEPRSTYLPGDPVERLDGTFEYRGYPRSTWLISWIDVATWTLFKSTYLSGELSGEMYISTRDDEDTFADYRVVCRLPNPASLRRWGGKYLNVEIEFILLEDVTP